MPRTLVICLVALGCASAARGDDQGSMEFRYPPLPGPTSRFLRDPGDSVIVRGRALRAPLLPPRAELPGTVPSRDEILQGGAIGGTFGALGTALLMGFSSLRAPSQAVGLGRPGIAGGETRPFSRRDAARWGFVGWSFGTLAGTQIGRGQWGDFLVNHLVTAWVTAVALELVSETGKEGYFIPMAAVQIALSAHVARATARGNAGEGRGR
jgi:hypothetical protein